MYNRIGFCQSPLSNLQYELFSLLRQGLALVNPLRDFYQFHGSLALQLGECFDALLTTSDVFREVGANAGIGSSLLELIGEERYSRLQQTRNYIRTFEPLSESEDLPPTFPPNFFSYFPRGFAPGFPEAFMAGLPNPEVFNLPPSFRADFESQARRILAQDLTNIYRNQLLLLGANIPPEGIYEAFTKRPLNLRADGKLTQAQADYLRFNFIPVPYENLISPQAVKTLNNLINMVPASGFRSYLPANEPIIPPRNFEGFAPNLIAKVNGDYNSLRVRTDYLSGARTKPLNFNNDDLDFGTALGVLSSALPLAQSYAFGETDHSVNRIFGMLNGQNDASFERISFALGSLSSIICGNRRNAYNAILNGQIFAFEEILRGALQLLLAELAGITLAHLANVALNLLFGQSGQLLSFIIPRISARNEYCQAFDVILDNVLSPEARFLINNSTADDLIPRTISRL